MASHRSDVTFLLLLVLALVATTGRANDAGLMGRIKNVVLVMYENRAFDHMLGYLPGVDGVPANRCNPYNTSDPDGRKACSNKLEPWVDADPCHSIVCTTKQIYGVQNDTGARLMNGFVESLEEHHPGFGREAIQSFDPTTVPIISTLAQEFAVCDKWFASIPGPTLPNRFYAMSGTSHGFGENSIEEALKGWPQKSLFRQLSDSKVSWRSYTQEVPSPLLFKDQRHFEFLDHFAFFENFLEDAEAGRLPQFSFLDPIYFTAAGIAATDQHPSHDVREGEQMMKEIYEAVRASPQWNDTLLVITYDEHGGFADHVPPPVDGVPNPDGINSTDPPFDFRRLGVRVPTLFISPWISKGKVVGAGQGPTPTSHYEHSSHIATLKKLFGWTDDLTNRTAWASTYEGVWTDPTVTEPRTDCPEKLPSIPRMSPEQIEDEGRRPVTDLQKELISFVSALHGVYADGEGFQDQAEAGRFVRASVQAYLDKLKQEKKHQ